MVAEKLDCVVVFHGDSHNSEYLAPCDERIAFISGFKGSNGLCVVTKDEALLWTDSRYYLAAEKQLYSDWKMMKMSAKDISWFAWVKDNMLENQTIGFDFSTYPAAMFEIRTKPLKEKGIIVQPTSNNLVDIVWGDEKPARPCTLTKVYAAKYAGMNPYAKCPKIACCLKGHCDMLLVTALDQIAWILNMRATDIDYNPVFFSYLVFYPKDYKMVLFTDANHFDDEAKEYLNLLQCEVKPYDALTNFLKQQV